MQSGAKIKFTWFVYNTTDKIPLNIDFKQLHRQNLNVTNEAVELFN